jgi:cell shape-determining protein MreD
MRLLPLLFLVLALILEVSLTTLPLILIALLILTIIYRKTEVFILAFIFGICFDILTFNTVGTTSIVLILYLFLVLLYQKKFEIATNNFVIIASFLGALGFLLVLGYTNSIIFQAISSSIITLLGFNLAIRFRKINSKVSGDL